MHYRYQLSTEKKIACDANDKLERYYFLPRYRHTLKCSHVISQIQETL